MVQNHRVPRALKHCWLMLLQSSKCGSSPASAVSKTLWDKTFLWYRLVVRTGGIAGSNRGSIPLTIANYCPIIGQLHLQTTNNEVGDLQEVVKIIGQNWTTLGR